MKQQHILVLILFLAFSELNSSQVKTEQLPRSETPPTMLDYLPLDLTSEPVTLLDLLNKQENVPETSLEKPRDLTPEPEDFTPFTGTIGSLLEPSQVIPKSQSTESSCEITQEDIKRKKSAELTALATSIVVIKKDHKRNNNQISDSTNNTSPQAVKRMKEEAPSRTTVQTSAQATALTPPTTSVCNASSLNMPPFALPTSLTTFAAPIAQSASRHFSCTWTGCNKKFDSNNKLARHQSVHTGEKRFKCTVCPKSYTQPGDLKIHMRIHTGEKPFECTLCLAKFTHKSTFTRHLRTHTGEKPYECPYCDKKFYESGGERSQHIQSHKAKVQIQTYACALCKIRLASHKGLSRHMWSQKHARSLQDQTNRAQSTLLPLAKSNPSLTIEST